MKLFPGIFCRDLCQYWVSCISASSQKSFPHLNSAKHLAWADLCLSFGSSFIRVFSGFGSCVSIKPPASSTNARVSSTGKDALSLDPLAIVTEACLSGIIISWTRPSHRIASNGRASSATPQILSLARLCALEASTMDNAVTRGTLPLREVALHWVRRVAVEALARQPIVSWCLNSVHLNVVQRLRSNLNSLIHFKICEISICIQDRQLQQFSCSLSFAKLQKLASNWQG